jgi:mono/diheme cytochrome c family protein
MKLDLRFFPLLALGLWALAACGTSEEMGTPAAAAPETEPAREQLGEGEAIAENLCATCHAIGMTGESPHPDALPLRQLSWTYPVEALAEPLAEGIMVGHPDMPEWQFEPRQIDALLAYLETIQVPPEG